MKLLSETAAREAIAMHGESLHSRGYVPGSSGNISIRVNDGILVSPTNSCLGRLDPGRIAKISYSGKHLGGDLPSKESILHASMYGQRKTAGAVVHLHSTYAVAVSCLCNVNDETPIRPITPYYVMKIGKLKVLPYFAPGDPDLARAVEAVAAKHHAILLANHGPVVAGTSVEAAVYAIEELEEAARLHLLLDGCRVNELSNTQILDLEERFPS